MTDPAPDTAAPPESPNGNGTARPSSGRRTAATSAQERLPGAAASRAGADPR